MEGSPSGDGADGGSNPALSWREVQSICAEMETMFQTDAPKDAERLQALIDKRKEMAAAAQTKQAAANKQLQHLLTNLQEWEERESATKARDEQLQMQLQELETAKREMNMLLERFRLDEHSSKQSLDRLMDKYEEARQQLVQFTIEHQNDVPLAKHQMSLYASVTGIKWDLSGSQVAGDIHVPAKQTVVRFEIDPATDHFQAANAIWDKVDEAFADEDGSDL